ncbi:MAG: hypothetical protein CME85_15440 [Henriciella sp.]|jgi:hypothetical protein|uniref:hypothetical protein n=1 Tax=Henriciella sp. TaxID=1968823 RepID=UPI000C10FD5D|nr:hypothetical protein [Henriciella sp.]MAN73713.1 hypothetical protein [Henriciella sp.]MBF35088.1 hypothetical protein [Hyphomonadaceae bacterium]MBK76860.1 hypothetical protein [Henriciella sp.]PHR75307.1 MAG: hypothetical protein COA64_12300 [Henriciella sp.]|tara:strand:+ start:3741 stop:4073 length:333 start_codon:yes stop_codon:yes gene_type:complete
MSERDHQRVEEVERQRGYGEGFKKGEDVEDQSTDGAGYKDGSPVADQQAHEADLVVDMDDERLPNVPNDDHDDDSSATIDGHSKMKKKPDGHLLEDAYSVVDPDVEDPKR